MSYEDTGQNIKELKQSVAEGLTIMIAQLNKLNAQLELMTDEPDPPRELPEEIT